jgi:hypothetical protein
MARLLDNARPAWLRRFCSKLIVLTALSACSVILNYASADAKNQAHAHAARVASGNDNATLHLVHANGSTLYEEGKANGSLPGVMHAWLDIGAKFAGRFVFYTRSGAISGQGSANWHQGRYPYVSFSGIADITSGTHHYIHTHGSLGFYGVLNRESDVVQFQTRGTLTY